MTDELLLFFMFEHLPPHLRAVSAPFFDMANNLIMQLPECHERYVALRKLLEAKDAAVRCAVLGHVAKPFEPR